MAPIKFEEQIKQKLEARNINPSDSSWNQLSKQLDTEKRNKKKIWFLYLGVAASVVGIILVTILFFKTSEVENAPTILVETNQEARSKTTNPSENSKIERDRNDSVETGITTNVAEISSEEKEFKKLNSVQNDSEQTFTGIANNLTKDLPEKNNKAIIKTANLLTPEDAKVFEVVAEIKRLENQDGNVSDAEIELLLKQAEREILKQRIYNETTRTVDANLLLQDVEAELDQSFRSKVFEALRTSFETVKTAVAERNN